MREHYPFTVKPLGYPYDALEPYIDKETMKIHHDRHYRGYVEKLNAALREYPNYHNIPLEDMLENISMLPEAIRQEVRNNGGGVFNHEMYFAIMQPNNNKNLELIDLINNQYGSMDSFKNKYKKAAMKRFGSGWAWLVNDNAGNLSIITTPNQDTPLHAGINPILPLDVWEHAYYLKYQNHRGDYIDNWFNVVNWEKANENYLKSKITN